MTKEEYRAEVITKANAIPYTKGENGAPDNGSTEQKERFVEFVDTMLSRDFEIAKARIDKALLSCQDGAGWPGDKAR